jgi:hypothetical protein
MPEGTMRAQSDIAELGCVEHEVEAGARTGAGLCWAGFEFDRARVYELGVPAYCWTEDGALWEFDEGEFFVTGLRDHGVRRLATEDVAPAGGWSHPADCACPACRVTRL